MFDSQLRPIYDGKVLANQTAMDNPVVKATLDAMAKRNFEPQRLNAYGVWYISDRHYVPWAYISPAEALPR